MGGREMFDPRFGDNRIACAAHTRYAGRQIQRQLLIASDVGPVCQMDQVDVRIDQSRNDIPPGTIDRARRRQPV